METQRTHSKNRIHFGSPDLKRIPWHEKRLVVGRYSYSWKNLLLVVISAIVILVLLFYVLNVYRAYLSDPNWIKQREINGLTLKIGRFMELPKGEMPTLATVTDREKLKGQDFFSNAKNGDKLLVYPKAQKAILYRPSTEKIIEVTNLTSSSQNNCPPQTETPQP